MIDGRRLMTLERYPARHLTTHEALSLLPWPRGARRAGNVRSGRAASRAGTPMAPRHLQT